MALSLINCRARLMPTANAATTFSNIDRCVIPYTKAMAEKWMDCETCEGKISAKARSCPHCGHSYLRNYGPLRYFSDEELRKYGTNVGIVSFCAIIVYGMSSGYWFNWKAAFVAALVCIGGPIRYSFHIDRLPFGDDPELPWQRIKRVFYLWLTGLILWFVYMYLFFESKSS